MFIVVISLDKEFKRVLSVVILLDNVETDVYNVPISLDKEFKQALRCAILYILRELSGIVNKLVGISFQHLY